ncbi:transcription factor WD40-like family [Populus alba x Populus x berolinensis]|nr:transcription factor WD40-like family [Populus alba x Populus x berolinensis]
MGQVPSFNLAQEFRELSERVKSVDLHPTKPWILAGLYSGTVCIWNYQTQVRTSYYSYASFVRLLPCSC